MKENERQNTRIPFPDSLRRADVEVASMRNGQHESLMLGNGDLYGIVWEKDNGLFMRITKNDIWDARVDTSKDGELPQVNPVTRKISGSAGAPPSYALPYPQPRCAVALRLGPVPEKMSGHLNLEKAVATIRSGDKAHTALRILQQQNVLLIHGPQPVVLEEIKAATLPEAKLGETDGVSWLLMKMPGDIDYKGMDYAVAVATNGDVKAVSIVTSFDSGSGDVLTRAIAMALKAAAASEQDLIAKHEQAWQAHWARSGVELGDKTVERWWYRMLYFAGCVCRPGAAPVPILPPLATDDTPWHADFHHNYNTWQAYWPLPAANHSELADPWISYNMVMIPRYKNLARGTYGLDGLHVPISSFLHEPDPVNCKSKNQRQMSMNPWGLTIGLQAMTLQNLWQKYLCDQDVAYMKEKIYPFLREVATFYVALMEKCQRDDKGKVLLGPSYSPEHGPMGIFNCPFDIAYVHYTFDAVIEAAATMKTDGELAGKCREFKNLLPDYPTTQRNGEEIVVDWVGGDHIAEHNITVPAAPVFPADQVTWFSDEAQKKLFQQTIRQTQFNNNNAHVMFNIARARLSMPEGYTEGKRWFASRELPNGLFAWAGHRHGTFMGEMIGIAGMINEYLLQSVDNKIRLFPCWPADQDAAFSRMRAQGGFIISASFKGGRVESAIIESVAHKQLVLLSPWKTMQVNGCPVEINKDGLVLIETKPGDVLLLSESTSKGKVLPVPGELFTVEGYAAFLIRPSPDKVHINSTIPWVWYAPTYINLPEEREHWMIQTFLEAGIAVAGVDVGVSHGNPKGRAGFSAFYKHMVEQRGFSPKPALLCRSQGGLMHYNWAAEHPESVGCIAGIYPVGDLRSWPGLEAASRAYGMTVAQLEEQLAEHNPVDRLAPLAKAKVPIFHIHGDLDKLVPLDANSGTVAARYQELGGSMTLQIAKGQGHNYWRGFFECQELVDFVVSHVGPPPRLPKVLLIGDSISGGYGAGVIKLLEGRADMVKLGAVESYRINNEAFWHSRGIAKTLDFGSAKACVADFERFERHLSEAKYDVIHFNFGLNDIYRGRNGRWHNPLEQYAEHLDKIVTLLKTNGAKIIWANTTPIPDNDPDRPVGDDLIYNAAAEKVMKKHGITINDLHGVITSWDGYAEWKKGNDVHFSGSVYTMLAKQSTDKILDELNIADDIKNNAK